MKIALIGYGKMGREIEQIAISRGHEIVAKIDVNGTDTFDGAGFQSADVAIEFTAPHVAYDNIQNCFKYNKPIVCGTTGWLDRIDTIKKQCEEGNTLFWASNFSLGVNVFFALNKYLAKIMNQFDAYDVTMEEVHHTQKLDAPSGTAITLAEGVLENISRKDKWVNDIEPKNDELLIKSVRRGEVPGIHDITYQSEVDEITIHHSAHSRKGFALGAVLAAEFTAKNKGFLGMNDLLKF